jgi:ABC-type multidrug transport system fused ATPase/permease subunit
MNSIIQELSIEEILNEKDGFNTLLGRKFGGTELSGGQWQRLAIARCLFKDGSLLLLDEPTSAIDPLSESEVLKKFLNMSKNKTSIIISHRIGICKFVDRIIVMKNGEIVEEGSHSQLIEKNGEYQKLYEAQSKWYCCN